MLGRRWSVFGTLGVVGAATVTTFILATGGPAAATAKLFVSPTGSDSCTLGGSTTTYAGASGHICATFSKACSLAAGNTVVVEAGNYPTPALQRYVTGDCSGGLGVDVNPNAAEQGVSTGTTANWTTFQCDTNVGTRGVIFGLGEATFKGNEHAIYDGGSNSCMYFWSLYAGEGGDTTLTSQNMIFNHVWVGGIDWSGAKNIELENSQIGPSVKCASNDTGMAAQYQCNPAGPWYEAPLATFNPLGFTSTQCPSVSTSDCGGDTGYLNEPFIHNNSGVPPTNNRLQNVFDHDQQSKNVSSVGSGWHPGGLLYIATNATLPDYDTVLDRVKFERIAVQGVQMGAGSGDNESGLAVENSVFGCPTQGLDNATSNPSGLWAVCALTAFGFKTAGGAANTTANVIVRYNDFLDTGSAITFSATTGTYSSVRVVGNVIGHATPNCPTGVTFDHNTSEVGTPCSDANSTTIVGNPFLTIDAGTSEQDSTSLIDASLTRSPAVGTVATLSGDTSLDHDYLGRSRTNGTHEGAYDH
jgi:hypothetical protein